MGRADIPRPLPADVKADAQAFRAADGGTNPAINAVATPRNTVDNSISGVASSRTPRRRGMGTRVGTVSMAPIMALGLAACGSEPSDEAREAYDKANPAVCEVATVPVGNTKMDVAVRENPPTAANQEVFTARVEELNHGTETQESTRNNQIGPAFYPCPVDAPNQVPGSVRRAASARPAAPQQ